MSEWQRCSREVLKAMEEEDKRYKDSQGEVLVAEWDFKKAFKKAMRDPRYWHPARRVYESA